MLLFNSRLCLFPGKLKSKWNCLYLITQLFPYGAVELENKEGVRFKVKQIENYLGHAETAKEVMEKQIENYLGHAETTKEVMEAYHLYEV